MTPEDVHLQKVFSHRKKEKETQSREKGEKKEERTH